MGFIFSLRTAPFVTVQQRTTRRDRGLREAFIKNRRKWRPNGVENDGREPRAQK